MPYFKRQVNRSGLIVLAACMSAALGQEPPPATQVPPAAPESPAAAPDTTAVPDTTVAPAAPVVPDVPAAPDASAALPPPAATDEAVPHYLQSRSARFVDWLADGSVLIRTRFGESEQIHRVRMPLGMREQVTFAAQGVTAARARPDNSDSLVYLEALHGGQSTRLSLQRLDTHEVRPLTDGQHRDGAALWAHDGHHLVFNSRRVNASDAELYEIDSNSLGTPVPRLLAGGGGARWHAFDWSGDDRHLLLGRETQSAPVEEDTGGETSVTDAQATPDTQLFIVDIDTGELHPISVTGGAGRHSATTTVHASDARYAADGHGILLLTDQTAPGAGESADERHLTHLVYLDLRSLEWRALANPSGHDVQRFDLSSDGRYIAYSYHDNGTDRLMLLDQQRRLDLAISQIPPGRIGRFRFDRDAAHLALSVESTRAPADVYVFDLQTSLVTAWTHSEVGPINPENFIPPVTLRFPTWDRTDSGQERMLPAALYRTPARNDPAPRPVLIWLCRHAGARCLPEFEPFVQCLVNEFGLVVVVPTIRASAPEAVRDVGSLLVWIGLQQELDRNRVALLGEGFGAYLTLQSLADYTDRLRGGVAAFAPHGSALAHSPAIRRPLLLVQGLNNPDAPAYELEQLRVRLRAQGADVSLVEAPDEGATFERKSDRDTYLTAAADFLGQLLR
jgi:dipeptidyl aminopeptidase/acylaminoacyl peptidase